MFLCTAEQLGRYSGGSHRKGCWLRNIHWPCNRMWEDCRCCQEDDGKTEGKDKEISPALVWRTCPSGEKATALTSKEWPSSVLRHVPVAASHSRTVLSRDADATSCPSGEKATALTSEEWPSSVLRHVPVAASHSRTVLS
jgi:hypothetical protein